LAIKDRRPFNFAQIRGGVVDMMRHPTVRLSIIVQTLCLGALFSILVMVQPIYDVIFDRADSFPFWFGAVAVVSASASILNAIIVVRIGMRRVVTAALFAQLCLSGAMLVLTGFELPQMLAFVLFLIWQTSLFFMAGVTLGNLNAIAMEPMGHIAGTAASIIGAISTVGAAIIAAPIGLLFNGSLVPLAFALTVMCILALVLMLQMSRVEKRQPA
ncbi:MAG: multidrug MFS transporter, partial [Pseudomonadota bacterium]